MSAFTDQMYANAETTARGLVTDATDRQRGGHPMNDDNQLDRISSPRPHELAPRTPA